MKHSYEIIPDLFVNGNSDEAFKSIQILPRFGLIDASAEGWKNLQTKMLDLNSSAPKGTSYRIVFIGRHGQGFHNVGEALYGQEEWKRAHAKLTGNGDITWGPDPKLTELGIQQAHVANAAWATEIPRGIPLPESSYSSPFTRALHTAVITFEGVLISTPDSPWTQKRPLIKEKLREMNGVSTCDKRSPRSHIAKEFPQFDFEPGFTEADELWTATHRETDEETTVRLSEALDEIFSEDPATYISITAHAGACRAVMRAVGIEPYVLLTGGVTVLPLKVIQHSEGS